MFHDALVSFAERRGIMMKELKLDLLPGNLYAAKKREEQQKGKGKNTQEQTNIVKLTEVSVKIGKQD